ncbi:MAG TPA: hypothetical protein VNI84_04030 [Pyrinomonadaceae bacterium]|nr:hypothetical protein [Pyrinomonadaceae bacterium]
MAYTIKLERDRTFEKTLTYKAGGVGVNLTGKEIVFHVRKNESKTDYLTISTADIAANVNGSRLIYTNRTGGAFSLLLTDEETKLMRFDQGFYSFSLEYGGRKDDLSGGRLNVSNP